MYPRCRLTFLLPASLVARAANRGSLIPGCVVAIDRIGLVAIDGPSRELVQHQAGRVLRAIAPDIIAGIQPPVSIAATMRTYEGRKGASARDAWQITVGADVAFAPTGLPVTIVDLTRDVVAS